MNTYRIKFINKDNELRIARTVANNRVEAITNIEISFNAVQILEIV